MLLQVDNSTETNCNLSNQAFTIKSSPLAFEILSSKLYSDTEMAVIRELLTNAYDAHIVAGTTDIPIDIHVPTPTELYLMIRDYGTGLSESDIYELYTTFFSSNKTASNDLTGCFGLGSKSPFAYSDSFTITSYYNGIKYTFIATKENGYPVVTKLKQENTKEHNGLKLLVPLTSTSSPDNGFKISFRDKLRRFLYFNPEIKTNFINADFLKSFFERKPVAYPYEYKDNNICITIQTEFKLEDTTPLGIYFKQGQNVFSLEDLDGDLTKQFKKDTAFIYYLIHNTATIITVPLGNLMITPNREQLAQTEHNINYIGNVLNILNDRALDYFEQIILPNSQKINMWSYRSLITLFTNKYKDIIDYVNTHYSYRKGVIANVTLKTSLREIKYTYSNDNCVLQDDTKTIELLQEQATNRHKKVIIILAHADITRKIRKLYSLLREYGQEFKDYAIYIHTVQNLSTVRYLYKVKKMCASNEKLFKPVTIISLSHLYRKYPITVDTTNTKSQSKNQVRGVNSVLFTPYVDSNNNIKMTRRTNKSDTVNYIINHYFYRPNTLIVLTDFSSLQLEFISMVMQLHETDGSNVFVHYFQDIFKNKTLTVNDIGLFGIAKSNKRLFKDYICVSFEQMKNDIIENYNWKILANEAHEAIFNRTIKNNLRYINPGIKTVETHSKLRCVANSNLHKKAKLFLQYVSKYNTPHLIIEFLTREQQEKHSYQTYMPDYINKVLNYIAILCQIGKNDKYYPHQNSQYKHQLYSLIAKEKKHVLF